MDNYFNECVCNIDPEHNLECFLSGNAIKKSPTSETKVGPIIDPDNPPGISRKKDDKEIDRKFSAEKVLTNQLQSINKEPLEQNVSNTLDCRQSPKSHLINRSTPCMVQNRIMNSEVVNLFNIEEGTSEIRHPDKKGNIKSKVVTNEDDKLVDSISKSTLYININSDKSVVNDSSDLDFVGRCDLLKAYYNQTEFKPSLNVESLRSQLITKRDQYKVSALQARREDNKDLTLNCLKTIKAINTMVKSLDSKQPFDLSNIPSELQNFLDISVTNINVNSQNTKIGEIMLPVDIEKFSVAVTNEKEERKLFGDLPPPPKTILEALQQRLEKYSATKCIAEAEHNSGKVRRLQRIIKLYETAITNHKAGKDVDFENLPTPPGFAPIPLSDEKPALECNEENVALSSESQYEITNKTSTKMSEQFMPNISHEKKLCADKTNTLTIREKQLEFLLLRQKLFRQAALKAKKNANITQAKEYLSISKGFDSVIEATKCGLPVDIKTVPTPPQLESDFKIIDIIKSNDYEHCNQEKLFLNLEKDLHQQIETCIKQKNYFLHLGDKTSAFIFEKLLLESTKDLATIELNKKNNESIPKFHHEIRAFPIIHSNLDLEDNVVEVTVKQGIDLPKSNELALYVKVEFPIPPENTQQAKTHIIKGTNNPVFEEIFKFEFNRKSRSQLRQFKRQTLKFEVWSKGSFFKSDTHLGTVFVKLADLESKCTVCETFNLMIGRKSCDGKLSVKLRIRTPLLDRHIEEIKEKWLVIEK
ncbi:coiled-coil and C2 domain-containing protein 1-like [Trichonephila inaurata madagascariensis]|uniref:Coiled-coil and C2 domain-containing protein 1-like n=1 Tax=Trichonephila inaurata madagascariensis TaxID=2747483 RepID=A0A8X6IQ58_9ARAC|nr:coiled-coil and C2 domain-containing protein 1-like [Trichonephila inaurata madagascariensis]